MDYFRREMVEAEVIVTEVEMIKRRRIGRKGRTWYIGHNAEGRNLLFPRRMGIPLIKMKKNGK